MEAILAGTKLSNSEWMDRKMKNADKLWGTFCIFNCESDSNIEC